VLNSETDVWSDVGEFEYHWHTGRRLEKEGKPTEAIVHFETAESLYKGDFLEDDLYEEWTWLQREALRDTYLNLLGRLADYSMGNADYIGCVERSLRTLAKDSCNENAYQHLMCAYSRLGQRNRAIKWYHTCKAAMKRELDVSPDHHTVELYHRILNDQYI